jgi:hypothetical protein
MNKKSARILTLLLYHMHMMRINEVTTETGLSLRGMGCNRSGLMW